RQTLKVLLSQASGRRRSVVSYLRPVHGRSLGFPGHTATRCPTSVVSSGLSRYVVRRGLGHVVRHIVDTFPLRRCLLEDCQYVLVVRECPLLVVGPCDHV